MFLHTDWAELRWSIVHYSNKQFIITHLVYMLYQADYTVRSNGVIVVRFGNDFTILEEKDVISHLPLIQWDIFLRVYLLYNEIYFWECYFTSSSYTMRYISESVWSAGYVKCYFTSTSYTMKVMGRSIGIRKNTSTGWMCGTKHACSYIVMHWTSIEIT